MEIMERSNLGLHYASEKTQWLGAKRSSHASRHLIPQLEMRVARADEVRRATVLGQEETQDSSQDVWTYIRFPSPQNRPALLFCVPKWHTTKSERVGEQSTDREAVIRVHLDEWKKAMLPDVDGWYYQRERSSVFHGLSHGISFYWSSSFQGKIESIEERSSDTHAVFIELVQSWKRDTEFVSTTEHMILHESYQRIIGLGPSVVPLLLQELKREPDHWFWALESITRVNPAEGADTFDDTVTAWLDWGARLGYVGREDQVSTNS